VRAKKMVHAGPAARRLGLCRGKAPFARGAGASVRDHCGSRPSVALRPVETHHDGHASPVRKVL
jgi:hypothetical protein